MVHAQLIKTFFAFSFLMASSSITAMRLIEIILKKNTEKTPNFNITHVVPISLAQKTVRLKFNEPTTPIAENSQKLPDFLQKKITQPIKSEPNIIDPDFDNTVDSF